MLGWNTRYALPQLRTYNDALKRYETTVPINRCPDKLRPVGLRKQKWFNIAKKPDNSIVLQYGCDKEYKQPDGTMKPHPAHILMTYHPNGIVSINPRYMGAADRERVLVVSGVSISRFDHKLWVNGSTHNMGEEVTGWFTVRKDEEIKVILPRQGARERVSIINAQPSERHKANKVESAQVMAKYQPFFDYLTTMGKLSDGKWEINYGQQRELGLKLPNILAEVDSPSPVFPTGGHTWSLGSYWKPEYMDNPYPANRDIFTTLVARDDIDSHYVALLWLVSVTRIRHTWSPVVSGSSPNQFVLFKEMLEDAKSAITVHHRDTMFDKVVEMDGIQRRDRFRNVFRTL
jgi:hypothetical protein